MIEPLDADKGDRDDCVGCRRPGLGAGGAAFGVYFGCDCGPVDCCP